MIQCSVLTPIGALVLVGDGHTLTHLYTAQQAGKPSESLERDDLAFGLVRRQLGEYFAGERAVFDVPLAPAGTEFQRQVWRYLMQIEYGSTTTYGEIANELGRPTAARAVGAANGRNPISIIVPCHRVVGSDGSLTGYAGGLPVKRWLLDHERVSHEPVTTSGWPRAPVRH